MFGFFYFWDMKDQLIYISKRPLWHYLIALPLYCLVIPMFFKMFDLLSLGQILNGLKFLLAIMFVFFCAAGLTFKKRVFTNSKLKDVRFNFTLFNIPLCKDIIFNDIKYISVYKNHSDRDFEVKLWLTETKKNPFQCI